MSITQRKIVSDKRQADYAEARQYCESADMRLSRDPKEGFWIHFDSRMRFVRSVSDIRGTVDWINRA